MYKAKLQSLNSFISEHDLFSCATLADHERYVENVVFLHTGLTVLVAPYSVRHKPHAETKNQRRDRASSLPHQITGCEDRAIGRMMIKELPAELLQEMC